MANRLYIPVGIPGCGKTTWVKTVLPFEDIKWVSSDMIRLEFFGKKYDASQNVGVFFAFEERISQGLYEGYDVVADATNLRDFSRKKLRDIAEIQESETHLVVFQNVTQALRRNSKRSSDVPGSQRVPGRDMMYMLDKYEDALRDIPLEKYTSVTYIGSFS